jgi:hypothetical protein
VPGARLRGHFLIFALCLTTQGHGPTNLLSTFILGETQAEPLGISGSYGFSQVGKLRIYTMDKKRGA